MKLTLGKIQTFCKREAVQFFLRTMYYLLILLALLWLYGFKDTGSVPFIYNEF